MAKKPRRSNASVDFTNSDEPTMRPGRRRLSIAKPSADVRRHFMKVTFLPPKIAALLKSRSSLSRPSISTDQRKALSEIPDADTKARQVVEFLTEHLNEAFTTTAIAKGTGISRKEVATVMLGLGLEHKDRGRILYAANPSLFERTKALTFKAR